MLKVNLDLSQIAQCERSTLEMYWGALWGEQKGGSQGSVAGQKEGWDTTVSRNTSSDLTGHQGTEWQCRAVPNQHKGPRLC